MSEQKILDQCRSLMEKAEAAYLTTIDGRGFPATRAMLNLRNRKQYPGLCTFFEKQDSSTEGINLFFTTNTSSTKVSEIMANPRVAVYFCSPGSWHGFMCQGNIEIVADKAIKEAMWQDAWSMYYPEGKESEDYAILCLKADFLKSYYQFQQTSIVF